MSDNPGEHTKVERMTSAYWRISSARNGTYVSGKAITTSDAIRQLGDNLERLNPARKLAQLTHELQYDIIEGDSKWRKAIEHKKVNACAIGSNLIPFTPKSTSTSSQ